MTTLTKLELTDMLIAQVPKLSRAGAKLLLEGLLEEIKASLARGEEVKISGFGSFQIRNKRKRPGRNPKTGESVEICARSVVTFRASQKLKALVEHYDMKDS
jgi:integration host factor subunit alpha (fragment)